MILKDLLHKAEMPVKEGDYNIFLRTAIIEHSQTRT